ncbi:MAG: CBS domain-containing protein [Candidatus Melainabacteria bacterium HGW-Melainabacteria-1]|nr:MAG: CBS domain-containing protein [Candidatus Melainabacteria bacterium HGW-Melainabacteria-1]
MKTVIQNSAPVAGIMSKEVYRVTRDRDLLEVYELMQRHGIRHVPVVESEDVIGMVSRTDMMRASYGIRRDQVEENKELLKGLFAEDVMTPRPVVVSPMTSIREAAEALAELDFSALPVIEAGVIVGIVTTTDLLRYLAGDS